MFPRNVPKRSLRMFPECFREKFYERSIKMRSERSYGRFQERSLWIFSEYCCGTFSQYSFLTFLERSTGTFREHCFGTFKKPGHFLSSRNVPWTFQWNLPNIPWERSGKVLCYGGWKVRIVHLMCPGLFWQGHVQGHMKVTWVIFMSNQKLCTKFKNKQKH